jgi:hypothetical protein
MRFRHAAPTPTPTPRSPPASTTRSSWSAPGGTFTLTAKFSKTARKKYAKAKKLKLNAVLTAKDSAGNGATAQRAVTLSR